MSAEQLPWFKFYPEMIRDPKIRRLNSDQRWFWVTLLSLASQSDERGFVYLAKGVPYEQEDFEDICGIKFCDQFLDDTLCTLKKMKMIFVHEDGTIQICNFEKRQARKKSSAERVKEHRERQKTLKKQNDKTKKDDVTNKNPQCNENVTLPNVTCNKNVTLEEEGEEEEELEKELIPPLTPPRGKVSGFENFWKSYPKKRSRGQAEKAWQALKPNEQLQDRILSALERAKTSADWQKDSGQFIPYPATWIRAKGWEDEICSEQKSASDRWLEQKLSQQNSVAEEVVNA